MTVRTCLIYQNKSFKKNDLSFWKIKIRIDMNNSPDPFHLLIGLYYLR